MKVSLIGGTGFVGHYITQQLIAAGHTPRLLVRPGHEHKVSSPEACETVSGELSDAAALDECLQGSDAVIYLVGILREFPAKGITFEATQYQGVVDTILSAKKNQVKRFVLMSANGIQAGGTAYQDTKYRAEQAVQESGLDWTVFRPSVIFGDPDGRMEFCTQLYQEMIKLPIPAPLFFEGFNFSQAGAFLMSPVHVDDVARVFVQSLEAEAMLGKRYNLCGGAAVSWRDIIQKIAIASGRRSKLALPTPVLVLKPVAGLLDRFPWFPITRDQLIMLMEGNTCDSHEGFSLLGITPRKFEAKHLSYLQSA